VKLDSCFSCEFRWTGINLRVGTNAGTNLTMKNCLLLFTILFVTVSSGCVISKKSTDKSVIKYVSKNTELVKAAAEFAVSVTYDQVKKDFLAKDVHDKDMRNKIVSLGSSVYVAYKSDSPYEILDSNVTFKTITLFGVTEVIYDFAATQRKFTENTKNRQEYYFVKLADRIYYRRRPIPMM
jgi:hypothetical protein